MAILTATAFGCGRQDPLPAGDEAEGEIYVAKPTEAPIGSLGGVCGKDFEKCQTEATITKAFGPSLKKTALKASCSEPGEVRINFKTPRLVNDHKGSTDSLVLRMAVTGFDTAQLSLSRNGMEVASSYSDAGQEGGWTEINYGGVEALFATFMDRAFVKKIAEISSKCSNWEEQVNNAASSQFYCGGGGKERHCRLSKILIGIAVGVPTIAVGAAGAKAAVVVAVGLGSLAVDKVIADLWSCDAAKEADRCESQHCDCLSKTTTRSDVADCQDAFNACCTGSGGRTAGPSRNPQQGNLQCIPEWF